MGRKAEVDEYHQPAGIRPVRGVRRVTWQAAHPPRRGSRRRLPTMCSRHSALALRSHGIETNRHTVEFSSNRRPNHSHQNFRSDRSRPGVVRSHCFALLFFFCLAALQILADPPRVSQFLAISLPAWFLRLPHFRSYQIGTAACASTWPSARLVLFAPRGAPDCIGSCFPLPNRPFAGRSEYDSRAPTPRDTDSAGAYFDSLDRKQKVNRANSRRS
jgi:hypothetical protein